MMLAEVEALDVLGLDGLLVRHALDVLVVGKQLVGAGGDGVVVPAGAGPPVTGSYLEPPSVGGLWDGVTTMPFAKPSPSKRWVPSAARLWVRIAWSPQG